MTEPPKIHLCIFLSYFHPSRPFYVPPTTTNHETINRIVNSSFPFRCECPQGFTGPLCQHNLNECESSPCVHGICVDQEDGFRCFCQPGNAKAFTAISSIIRFYWKMFFLKAHKLTAIILFIFEGFSGDLCNYEYNECDSNPCVNSGQCIDHIGGYTCQCTKGYQGQRCHIKVNSFKALFYFYFLCWCVNQ